LVGILPFTILLQLLGNNYTNPEPTPYPLPYISQYFLSKFTVSTRKYCTVKKMWMQKNTEDQINIYLNYFYNP